MSAQDLSIERHHLLFRTATGCLFLDGLVPRLRRWDVRWAFGCCSLLLLSARVWTVCPCRNFGRRLLGLYLQSSRTRYFWLNTVLMFARRGFSILSHIDGRSNLPGVRRSRPEEVFERILCSVVNVQIAYRCVLVGTGKDGGRGVQISAFPSRSVCRDELHTRWPLARSHTLSGPFSAVLESRLPECGVEIRRASCPVFAGRMLSALRGVDRSLPAACLLSCQRRVSKLQKTVAYLISRTPDRLVLITSSGVVVERRLPSRWCHHRASRRTLPPRSLHSMLRTVRGSALLQRAFLEHLDADGMSEKNSS